MEDESRGQRYSEYVEDNIPGIVDGFRDAIMEELYERHPLTLQAFLETRGWTINRPIGQYAKSPEAGVVMLTRDGADYLAACTRKVSIEEAEE